MGLDQVVDAQHKANDHVQEAQYACDVENSRTFVKIFKPRSDDHTTEHKEPSYPNERKSSKAGSKRPLEGQSSIELCILALRGIVDVVILDGDLLTICSTIVFSLYFTTPIDEFLLILTQI